MLGHGPGNAASFSDMTYSDDDDKSLESWPKKI